MRIKDDAVAAAQMIYVIHVYHRACREIGKIREREKSEDPVLWLISASLVGTGFPQPSARY
jgi:hypothetical protein